MAKAALGVKVLVDLDLIAAAESLASLPPPVVPTPSA
jgi:hypothetical protein